MRIVETKVYKFEELSKEAQEKAIEEIRNSYYECNEFSEWAIDDCYLLNPPYKEVEKYNFDLKDGLLMKNNRTIYFSLGRDRYIDISKAMEVQDSDYFLHWLGITDGRLIDKIDYFIEADSIEILNQSDEDFTAEEEELIENAIEKFKNHCEDILKSIEESIDYRFTDESIKEDIEANEREFEEDGTIF